MIESVETETLDKLFLELSQFTRAKTARELRLERELASNAKSTRTRLVEVVEGIAATHNSALQAALIAGTKPSNTNQELRYSMKSLPPLKRLIWKVSDEQRRMA